MAGKGPLPLCRRTCTEEFTVCKVDVDCCVGNICKDDPDIGKLCVPNYPPSECTGLGFGCTDDNQCCGADATCGRAKSNTDPPLCMIKACKTSGQTCSNGTCCPGFKCNSGGIHNGLPRCIRK